MVSSNMAVVSAKVRAERMKSTDSLGNRDAILHPVLLKYLELQRSCFSDLAFSPHVLRGWQ